MTSQIEFRRGRDIPVDVAGFSLIEMMVIIVLIGIIMSIAVPAGRDFIVQSRLTSQANTLVSDILYSRNEAASRGVNIVICPSANSTTCSTNDADWSKNRYIFIDTNGDGDQDAGEKSLKFSAMPAQMTLTPQGFTDLTQIRFNNSGGLVPLGTSGSFKLCNTGASVGRIIDVGINGRPSSSRTTCP